MNIRLVSAFPRKMASRLTGEISSPSSPPCSWSRTNARFMARTATKAKAAHRMPGASSSDLPGVLFRAKLNTTTTSNPKTTTEIIRSLDRNSSNASFQTMIMTGPSNPITVRPPRYRPLPGGYRYSRLCCRQLGYWYPGRPPCRRATPQPGAPRSSLGLSRAWS